MNKTKNVNKKVFGNLVRFWFSENWSNLKSSIKNNNFHKILNK